MNIPTWFIWTALISALLSYAVLLVQCIQYSLKRREVSEMKYIREERINQEIFAYNQKLLSLFIIRSIVAGIVAVFFYGLGKPLLLFATLFCFIVAVLDLYAYFVVKDSLFGEAS